MFDLLVHEYIQIFTTEFWSGLDRQLTIQHTHVPQTLESIGWWWTERQEFMAISTIQIFDSMNAIWTTHVAFHSFDTPRMQHGRWLQGRLPGSPQLSKSATTCCSAMLCSIVDLLDSCQIFVQIATIRLQFAPHFHLSANTVGHHSSSISRSNTGSGTSTSPSIDPFQQKQQHDLTAGYYQWRGACHRRSIDSHQSIGAWLARFLFA